jgi:hypothetical protein
VPAASVVKAVDPGADLGPSRGAGAEAAAVDEFDLDRGVDRLGGGVVQR